MRDEQSAEPRTALSSGDSFVEDEGPAWQEFYSLGVLACFTVSSLTQEALTSKHSGVEFYGFETSLVFVQSTSAVVAALSALAFTNRHATRRDGQRPWRPWVVVCVAYYLSHYFGLASLRHLSYPVHVTFKSCKPIPVFLGERLLTSKRHSAAKALGVVVLCLGAAAFLVGGADRGRDSTTTLLGVGLVGLALVADGVYAGSQVVLVQRCASEFHLMLVMNLWQALFSGIYASSTGELATVAALVRDHRKLATALAAFALSKSLGTLFVYKLLRTAGTLRVATVTTLRKVCSVLISVWFFGHHLTLSQWLALLPVFFHKYFVHALALLLPALRPRAAPLDKKNKAD